MKDYSKTKGVLDFPLPLCVSPANIIGGFVIPLTLLSLFLLFVRLLGGLRVFRFHNVYISRLSRGRSRNSGLADCFLLYQKLLQLI
jgi:hypothetical protein